MCPYLFSFLCVRMCETNANRICVFVFFSFLLFSSVCIVVSGSSSSLCTHFQRCDTNSNMKKKAKKKMEKRCAQWRQKFHCLRSNTYDHMCESSWAHERSQLKVHFWSQFNMLTNGIFSVEIFSLRHWIYPVCFIVPSLCIIFLLSAYAIVTYKNLVVWDLLP